MNEEHYKYMNKLKVEVIKKLEEIEQNKKELEHLEKELKETREKIDRNDTYINKILYPELFSYHRYINCSSSRLYFMPSLEN